MPLTWHAKCAVFFTLLLCCFAANFWEVALFLKLIIDIWMKTMVKLCGCQKAHDPKIAVVSCCGCYVHWGSAGAKWMGDAKIASKALPQVLHVLLWAFELYALLKIIVFLCYFILFFFLVACFLLKVAKRREKKRERGGGRKTRSENSVSFSISQNVNGNATKWNNKSSTHFCAPMRTFYFSFYSINLREMKERSTNKNWYRNKWKSRSMWKWSMSIFRSPNALLWEKKRETKQEEEINRQTRDESERTRQRNEQNAHTLSRTRS